MASTSIALHPTPATGAVAAEQFRAVGRAIRSETYFFLGALALFGILLVVNVVRMMHTFPDRALHSGFTYSVAGAIPIFLIALLIPFGVWRSEDPARRSYLWSMPVARGPHTLMKVASGWIWLMLASAVYLVFLVILASILAAITGEANRIGAAPAWEWVVTFSAPTLAYLLISIPVIGSNHAWRWIGGIVLGYLIIIGVLSGFDMNGLSAALSRITNGTYGLHAALFGSTTQAHGPMTVGINSEMMRKPVMDNWLIAMPLWIIGSLAAVVFVSYRHRD